VVRDPEAEDLREHRMRVREGKRERRELNRLRREPSRTRDGVDIRLWANAESREDVAEAHALGAAGVGLYRTEFLFLGRRELPDEETQFRAYRDLVLGMTGRTVTIRTLDLGADKADNTGLVLPDEPNPALGVRGVRLSLRRKAVFEAQLRAIVRASDYGPVRLLVPMVASREEVLAVRAELERTVAALRAEGHATAEQLPLGTMIEVPAAALALPGFIDAVDFLSVGTNDLIQYLLAADRNNEALGDLYTPLHPALVRLLADVIATARANDKPIAVCGEMAGDAALVPLLLALGLEEFSLHPATLLEVRQAIRACDLSGLRARTAELVGARDRVGIETWLREVTSPTSGTTRVSVRG
jgi:phosphotransferase system enzyme I (PtsI)